MYFLQHLCKTNLHEPASLAKELRVMGHDKKNKYEKKTFARFL